MKFQLNAGAIPVGGEFFRFCQEEVEEGGIVRSIEPAGMGEEQDEFVGIVHVEKTPAEDPVDEGMGRCDFRDG